MQDVDKERKIVNTEISIHPDYEARVSEFQKECLNDEISSLPPIKEGEMNISTDYIFDMGDKYEANIFIRNGLSKPINFEQVPLLIENSNGEIIASKVFNLREIGEIPPCGVRPWKIYFEKDIVEIKDNKLSELKVIFDSNIQANKTLKFQFEDFPKEIEGENKKRYEKFLDELPFLRNGQVSIATYDVVLNDKGGLSVILVIRNGNDRQIKLEKLPICVKDSRDIEIARGIFELKDEEISVSPRKAKLYSFVFPSNSILQDELHLDKWSVNFNF